MRKSFVLKALFGISLTFLLFQILSVSYIFNKNQPKPTKTAEFLKLYQKLKVPLFLLELDVPNVQNNTLNELHRRGYLTFGIILQHNSPDIETNKDKFEELGYEIISSTHSISRPKKEVVSHTFLVHKQSIIHIVFFYKRTPELVWSTAVSEKTLSVLGRTIRNKPFVEYAYLLESFRFKKWGDFLVPDPADEFIKSLPSSRFIECNETRAKLFRENYPQDGDEESQTFQRKARQIIARAKRYLDDLDIQFWLSSGTCLGWFRQCDIITYSKDVDFGIWIKDYKPQLIPVFEHGGFFLKHIFGKTSDSYELSFQAGDIKLDLFFFYEDGDSMWNGGTHHETGQKYKYIFPKFSLCWTEFLELYIRVPCPPQPYIEANYGKNWMEPVKTWDWNKSPPNVRENGFWDKDEWMDVIQVF